MRPSSPHGRETVTPSWRAGAVTSSLVDKWRFLQAARKRVGLVLRDPSSPFSEGHSGRPNRMQTLGTNAGVFIRSMATRGNLCASRFDCLRGAILDAAATRNHVETSESARRIKIFKQRMFLSRARPGRVTTVQALKPALGDWRCFRHQQG